ncbi:MAG: RNA polymerase sigma factor [Paracoccaceae bacterium]
MAADPHLASMQSGDEAAFASVYRALNPAMVRLAHAITGSAASAQEVSHDAWIAAINGLDDFQGRASFRSWVFTILANKARTLARRDGRLRPLDVSSGPNEETLADHFTTGGKWAEPPALWDEITPERILAGKQALRLVEEIIATLPPTQGAILALLEGEKMPAEEIADLLGTSAGNVRVHLHRARERIRQELDRHRNAAAQKHL